MADQVGETVGREARLLLRAARMGTLATAGEGQPFASLVTPAVAADGSLLMLLSGLSDHTRHLRTDGRCAVMVSGAATDTNPQTAPRVTVTGTAAPDEDAALRRRWLALHPYADFYAGLDDFRIWRLVPGGGQFIGGFARAYRLDAASLVPDPAAWPAVAAAEAGVVEHCNTDHPDALDLIAGAAGLDGEGWRMAACDVDGFDLVRGEVVRHLAWPEPVDGAGAIRRALIHLAGAARNAAITSSGPA